MPCWLRTLTSLPKDLGSIPSTHVADHSHLNRQFQGILYPLQASEATRLTHKAYTHKVKNNILMYKIPKTYRLHIDWHFLCPQNRHPASRRCRRPLNKVLLSFCFLYTSKCFSKDRGSQKHREIHNAQETSTSGLLRPLSPKEGSLLSK